MKYFRDKKLLRQGMILKRAPAGFRYGFIPNLFKEEIYNALLDSFPEVTRFEEKNRISGEGRKHFFVGPLYSADRHWGSLTHLSTDPIWIGVMKEASGEFLEAFQELTGVAFNTMCTFGFTYGKEGSVQEPHLDGAVREGDVSKIHSTIACLVYFNREHGNVGATEVYAENGKTLLFRAPDMRNGIFFFEQHKEAWHGFPMMPKGTERRLVSLAYSLERRPIRVSTFPFKGIVERALWSPIRE